MSTKSSLRFETDDSGDRQVHIYRDLVDDDHVYLELTGFPFEAASSVGLLERGPVRVTIQLSEDWARKLGLAES